MSIAIDRLKGFLSASPSVIFPQDAFEYIPAIEAENAKLRELCKTLYQLADESYVPFGSVNRWMDDFAKAICAMRELGIEVEK